MCEARGGRGRRRAAARRGSWRAEHLLLLLLLPGGPPKAAPKGAYCCWGLSPGGVGGAGGGLWLTCAIMETTPMPAEPAPSTTNFWSASAAAQDQEECKGKWHMQQHQAE